jgi:hypothetical protein
MRSNYLPKVAVAVLALSIVLVVLSGQSVHVAATHSMPQNSCNYSSYYSSYYYWYPYYYYYGYPYYYCSYSYTYYPYYSYYYPYYSYYYGYGMGGYGMGNYGSSSYYSTPSNYQLTVATDPSTLGTVTGGGTYSQGSSASFSVTQATIQSSANTRYVFSHWSGDFSGVGTSGTVTMNGARKIVAVYQLQNYLSVNVQPQSVPVPGGAGWYNAGDTATLTSPGQTLNADSGSRLVFQGWSIDGQNTQPTASLSVKMDAPHSATAVYAQQYYLKVLTDQGVTSGDGWYGAGTTAQIYVSTPTSTTYGVSYVFNGWQGDVQSNSQSASVLMDKPRTAIASWRTDSTVLYLTIALGIIAALVAVGIVAFVARGRGPQPAAAPVEQAPPKKRHTDSKDQTVEQ